MRGVWLGETPRPQVPSAILAVGAGRGTWGDTLPFEPLPPLPPPGRRRDYARPLFRRGLGRGGRIRARAFRPQGPPAPSARPAVHRWFSAREGQAAALLYNNRALRAGSAPPRRRGPHPATPPSGPRPARPAPRRRGRKQRARLAGTSSVTCWPCRAAETFPATPSPPWSKGSRQALLLASYPPQATSEPQRPAFGPPPDLRVTQRPAPTEPGGGGDRVLARSAARRRSWCSLVPCDPQWRGLSG